MSLEVSVTLPFDQIQQAGEFDTLDAVREIASPSKAAIGRMRMLWADSTAGVGWIESVITSSFNFDEAMRATAPPDSTPWVI